MLKTKKKDHIQKLATHKLYLLRENIEHKLQLDVPNQILSNSKIDKPPLLFNTKKERMNCD